MANFKFCVTGTSYEEVEMRVQEHLKRGAVLISEIKEGYFQSKNFVASGYSNVKMFQGNYESQKFFAMMQRKHVDNPKRRKWNYE